MRHLTSFAGFYFLTALLLGCGTDGLPDAETVSSTSPLKAQIQELLAQLPGSTQVDEHSISWDNGKVMLILPDVETTDEVSIIGSGPSSIEELSQSPLAAAVHGCPSGWYCVYEHRGWGGRRLQFSDCSRNDLSNFGFRDKTSSWVNNGSRRIQVRNNRTAFPDQDLWRMPPHNSSSYVGDSDNDKADFFECY